MSRSTLSSRELYRSSAGLIDHQGVLKNDRTLQRNPLLICWGPGGERFPCHSLSSDGVKLLLIEVPVKKRAFRANQCRAARALKPEWHLSSHQGQPQQDKAGSVTPPNAKGRGRISVRKPQTSTAAVPGTGVECALPHPTGTDQRWTHGCLEGFIGAITNTGPA